MEVSQPLDHITHAVIGGGKTIDFGISNSAEFFDILSRTLYTDQILAVVREVLCNAWDAHIAAGCTDKPINPKEVAKTVAGMSRKEQAQKLLKAYKKNRSKKNKDALFAFKKSVKLGWKALGIDETEL